MLAPGAAVLRLFNVYGPGQTGPYAGVVSKFIERAKRGLPPVIYGDGTQTRDFIHVADVAQFVEIVLKRGAAGIYNVGTGRAEIPTTVKYHEASSKANPLLQGLNLLWSILWTALTKRPALTLTLGATSLIIFITLFIHTLTIFNATRYIRLTYTTLAILLEVVAVLLIAIASVITKQTRLA
jgi:hypothetical protein